MATTIYPKNMRALRPAQALASLWTAEGRPLAWLVAGSLALLAITLVGLAVDPRLITGQPAWLKPMKFAISTALYSATLAWMLRYITGHPRLVRLVSWTTALGLIVELVLILTQVVRGVPSHFNLSSAFDGALFSTMGALIVAVWLMNLLVAGLLLRQRLPDRAFAWSLRLGVLISSVGMAVAFLMTSRPSPAQQAALAAGQMPASFGAHSVGVEDGGPGLPVVGWSTEGGDLRIPHFVGLHGLQVLPLLAYALKRSSRLGAGQQLGLVWTGGLSYLGLTGLLTWQALRGQPLLRPDALTLAAAAGLAVVVGVASCVIVRVSSPQKH